MFSSDAWSIPGLQHHLTNRSFASFSCLECTEIQSPRLIQDSRSSVPYKFACQILRRFRSCWSSLQLLALGSHATIFAVDSIMHRFWSCEPRGRMFVERPDDISPCPSLHLLTRKNLERRWHAGDIPRPCGASRNARCRHDGRITSKVNTCDRISHQAQHQRPKI
jgi:hypothetical protein